MSRYEKRVLRLRNHVLASENVAKEQKKSELPDYDELTKADIRELLDERKVAYNKRDNKDELYSLLTESE